ncbi:MAG: phosphoenolpyruvate carboxykinase domain-containing protein [Vicinamibacterales bacterium]
MCRSARSSSVVAAHDDAIYQAFNWSSGVYTGATMGSETTAAATGQVGKVRRDPMAMLPFCGLQHGRLLPALDQHAAEVARRRASFHVNWFRKNKEGIIRASARTCAC